MHRNQNCHWGWGEAVIPVLSDPFLTCLCYVKCLCNHTENKGTEVAGKIARQKGLFYTRSGQGSKHWCCGRAQGTACEKTTLLKESTQTLFLKNQHFGPILTGASSPLHDEHQVSWDLTNSLPDGDALPQSSDAAAPSDAGTEGPAGPREGTRTLAAASLPVGWGGEMQATARPLWVPFAAQSGAAVR